VIFWVEQCESGSVWCCRWNCFRCLPSAVDINVQMNFFKRQLSVLNRWGCLYRTRQKELWTVLKCLREVGFRKAEVLFMLLMVVLNRLNESWIWIPCLGLVETVILNPRANKAPASIICAWRVVVYTWNWFAWLCIKWLSGKIILQLSNTLYRAMCCNEREKMSSKIYNGDIC